jgi:uncharacterized protein YcbK (DUF882 family)
LLIINLDIYQTINNEGQIMGDLSKYFDRSEFKCKCGCGFDTVDHELIVVLEEIRLRFGKPVTINSGCRCERHNAEEGGSKGSQHITGKAADIVVAGVHADSVADHLVCKYQDKYGIGRYNGRTHIDVRSSKARWDNRK